MNSVPIRFWSALNWPNRISLGRLLLVAPFILLIMNQNAPGWEWARPAALVIFAVMAISDFVDGTLARRLNLKTRLGAVLDPLADKVLIVFSVILLSFQEFAVPGAKIPNWVVVAVVGKDLWVVIGFLVIYMVTGRFFVRPNVAGKLSTLVQLVMVILVLLVPELERLRAGLGHGAAMTAWALVAMLALTAVISYTRLGLAFAASRQKPIDEHGPSDA